MAEWSVQSYRSSLKLKWLINFRFTAVPSFDCFINSRMSRKNRRQFWIFKADCPLAGRISLNRLPMSDDRKKISTTCHHYCPVYLNNITSKNRRPEHGDGNKLGKPIIVLNYSSKTIFHFYLLDFPSRWLRLLPLRAMEIL